MTVRALVDWMIRDALPVWSQSGADPATGLFREKLELDGRAGGGSMRTRTLFRQVYVFAHAPLLGLADRDRSLALARRGAEALRAVAWAPDGRPGWVHRFEADGRVVDDRRDLYDHAFVLLGLAWLRAATGEARYDAWIDETIEVVDSVMAAPFGGHAESDRSELPRRQNPHMHLFESCLALHETTGEPRWLARAGELYALFRSRFLDETDGTLTEYFGEDWRRDAAFGSQRLEPGHMMEWVWLARRYALSSGRPVDDVAARLFAAAERTGLEAATGFLVDEVDASGRILAASRRLWPQTEYLKALLMQGEATGETALFARADALAGRILTTYLADIPRGCWRDRFDLDGRMIADHIPASILYHLLAPVAEIVRIDGKGLLPPSA
jgi:mannose-6-phosphate isomerase